MPANKLSKRVKDAGIESSASDSIGLAALIPKRHKLTGE